MNYLYLGLAVLLAYLLGSLSFAVIVSRAMGLKDPRSYGRKNWRQNFSSRSQYHLYKKRWPNRRNGANSGDATRPSTFGNGSGEL